MGTFKKILKVTVKTLSVVARDNLKKKLILNKQ